MKKHCTESSLFVVCSFSMLGHTGVFDDYKSVEYGWVLRYCFDFIAVFEWSGVASFEYSSSVAALPR